MLRGAVLLSVLATAVGVPWAVVPAHPGPETELAAAPAGHDTWLLTGPEAADTRRSLFRRAALHLGANAPDRRPPRPVATSGVVDGESLDCRYLPEPPSGTTSKFSCVLAGGAVVKVKYGRNPELHAEVAATALLHRLGYPADTVTFVPRVRCHGCPRYPFFATTLLTAVPAAGRLAARADGYTDFAWVSVEHRFPAPEIETSQTDGWPFWELRHSAAPAAERDALRLLAVFLAHWDNKGSNQRLVCLEGAADGGCARPVALLQDVGATFGPVKVNLAQWRSRPIWHDRATCLVSMRALPFGGGTFEDTHISEAGRARLAARLTALPEADVRQLFAGARFPEFHPGHDRARVLDAWTAAFRHRVDQIVTAGPCPDVAGRDRPAARTTP